MTFPVKKNPLLILLTLSLLPIGVLGAYTDPSEGWIGLIIVIPIAGLLIWALFQSYHEVTDDAFIGNFGPIKKRVPLKDIRSVKYSFNPLSSPAWTFKRLEITDSNYNVILLSAPKNENNLREVLKERCPQAKILL